MSEQDGAGRRVGAYRLDSLLGQGGAARTWLAVDERDGRRYALKELQLVKSSNAKQVELFERECAILKELEHPQIPRFIETIVERRTETMSLFLVQELVDGRSLQQILDAGVRPSPDDVVAMVRSCLGPLEYLHSRAKPLYHRDLKPSNILLRNDGTCVLVDFGAVREAIADPRTGGSSVVGTFGYMAPEQFQARAYPSTDLYALGATALHLATGRDPGSFEIKRLKPDFHAAMPEDAHLAAILDLLLEPAVEDRYASTTSLARALDRWQATRPAGAPAAERLKKVLAEAMAAEERGDAERRSGGRSSARALPAPAAAPVSRPAPSPADVTAPQASSAASTDAATPPTGSPPPAESAAPTPAPIAAVAPAAPAPSSAAQTATSAQTASATPAPAAPAAARAAAASPTAKAAKAGGKPTPAAKPAREPRKGRDARAMPAVKAAAPARAATAVPVQQEAAPALEALLPGGQGARQMGLSVIALGATLIAVGMFGGMQYNAHVPIIIGCVAAAWGIVLAGWPRSRGRSGPERLHTTGRHASPQVTRIRRRASALGGTEWHVDFEYEAVDGLHYTASYRLAGAKLAQRVATQPDAAVVRYEEFDPSSSILVVRG